MPLFFHRDITVRTRCLTCGNRYTFQAPLKQWNFGQQQKLCY